MYDPRRSADPKKLEPSCPVESTDDSPSRVVRPMQDRYDRSKLSRVYVKKKCAAKRRAGEEEETRREDRCASWLMTARGQTYAPSQKVEEGLNWKLEADDGPAFRALDVEYTAVVVVNNL